MTSPFDIRRVEEMAGEEQISRRTSCFCNPGAGETAHELKKAEISAFFHQREGMNFDQLRRQIRQQHQKVIGAIRISVGIATNFADVYRFIGFARDFLNKTVTDIGQPVDDGAATDFARDSA